MKNCDWKSLRRKAFLIAGIAWLVFLGVAYGLPVQTEAGDNYIIEDTLLGIAIFHNPLILGLYMLVGVALVAAGSGVRLMFE